LKIFSISLRHAPLCTAELCSGLSEIANINESLISQYAHWVKKPGTKQLKRIKTALHKFADDLYAISF